MGSAPEQRLQPVQGEVGQRRGDDTALWRAIIRRVQSLLVHKPGLQPLPKNRAVHWHMARSHSWLIRSKHERMSPSRTHLADFLLTEQEEASLLSRRRWIVSVESRRSFRPPSSRQPELEASR